MVGKVTLEHFGSLIVARKFRRGYLKLPPYRPCSSPSFFFLFSFSFSLPNKVLPVPILPVLLLFARYLSKAKRKRPLPKSHIVTYTTIQLLQIVKGIYLLHTFFFYISFILNLLLVSMSGKTQETASSTDEKIQYLGSAVLLPGSFPDDPQKYTSSAGSIGEPTATCNGPRDLNGRDPFESIPKRLPSEINQLIQQNKLKNNLQPVSPALHNNNINI